MMVAHIQGQKTVEVNFCCERVMTQTTVQLCSVYLLRHMKGCSD